jgi:hypothetical protein
MPTIQIYLNQELFDFVKADKSKIIQRALIELKEKLKTIPLSKSADTQTNGINLE